MIKVTAFILHQRLNFMINSELSISEILKQHSNYFFDVLLSLIIELCSETAVTEVDNSESDTTAALSILKIHLLFKQLKTI